MVAVVALVGSYGVFLLYTSVVMGWRGLGVGPPSRARMPLRSRLPRLPAREVLAVMGVLFLVAAAATYGLFGGVLPALVAGVFAATFPSAWQRSRRERRLAEARQAWPRMIEEIRLLTGSLGRSIPQALLEVGRRGPEEFRPAFAAAEREWLISTDFGRAVAVLKTRLADATADATCETLLVAHEIGGADVDRRLAALAEDRHDDLQGRKDAAAKQAGVRFARRFVLIVPLGMAVAGLSIGTGRAAYETAAGQTAVVGGLAAVVACWVWAGRLMRLPEEQRVFDA